MRVRSLISRAVIPKLAKKILFDHPFVSLLRIGEVKTFSTTDNIYDWMRVDNPTAMVTEGATKPESFSSKVRDCWNNSYDNPLYSYE